MKHSVNYLILISLILSASGIIAPKRTRHSTHPRTRRKIATGSVKLLSAARSAVDAPFEFDELEPLITRQIKVQPINPEYADNPRDEKRKQEKQLEIKEYEKLLIDVDIFTAAMSSSMIMLLIYLRGFRLRDTPGIALHLWSVWFVRSLGRIKLKQMRKKNSC